MLWCYFSLVSKLIHPESAPAYNGIITAMKPMPNFLFIGGMREDYCITADRRVISGQLGGNAVYSAVGARIWTDNVAILSRIGIDYPSNWLHELQQVGIDVSAIKILAEPQQSITFYAYASLEQRIDTNPMKHFAEIDEPMPKKLIGYKNSTPGQDSRTELIPLSIRPGDLELLNKPCLAAHLAPAEFLTHSTVPYALRKQQVETLTLDPSVRYMTPDFKLDLPKLMQGIDAFLPSEMEARSFFAPTSPDIWRMADQFADMGCRYVVIKLGAKGQALLDATHEKRWEIPAYPAKVRDVTGAGDSFCGGFLVGLVQTGDPLEATLWGNISASLTVEGTGALYALDRTPGLAHARLKSLRTTVKRK